MVDRAQGNPRRRAFELLGSTGELLRRAARTWGVRDLSRLNRTTIGGISNERRDVLQSVVVRVAQGLNDIPPLIDLGSLLIAYGQRAIKILPDAICHGCDRGGPLLCCNDVNGGFDPAM